MSLPYDPDAIEAEEGDDSGHGFEGFEPSKDLTILLVDASKEMARTMTTVDDAQVSCLHGSIFAAYEVLRSKIIAAPSDEVALVFYNTRETKNSAGFENVYIFWDLDSPDAGRIRAAQKLAEGSAFEEQIGSAAGVDAATGLRFGLWVALQLFGNKSSKTTFREVFIFTVNDDPTAGTAQPQTYREQLRGKCRDLVEAGVRINPFPLARDFRMAAFWADMMEAAGYDADAIAEASDACKLDDLWDHVRVVTRRRRSLASLRWTVAPDLDIGLQVHSLVQAATKGAATYLRSTDHAPLRADTAYICQDTGTLLRLDADIQKYRFDPGKGCFPQVVLLNTERAALKASLPPGLQLLGFKPADALKPYHQLTHSYYLHPSDRELQGSTQLYYALYAAMKNQGRVAICSFVRNKSSEPRLVALLPFPPTSTSPYGDSEDTVALPPAAPDGLHMVPLPFADDLRAPETDPDIAHRALDATATEEQVEAAVAMVKGLMLSRDDHPSFLPNPALQRHYEILEAFALQEEVPPLEEFEDNTRPDPDGFSAKQHLLAAFAQATGLDRATAAAAAGSKKRGRPLTEGVDANGAVNIRQMAEAGKLSMLRVPDLKDYLGRHKLRISGAKADLVQRVLEHLGLEAPRA